MQERVQRVRARRPFVHRDENLDVPKRIHATRGGEEIPHEPSNLGRDLRGFLTLDEYEIPFAGRDRLGQLAGEYPVGVPHDAAAFVLPKDLPEPGRRDDPASDEIPKNLAGTDGGKLIRVADEHESRVARHRGEKDLEQAKVDHRRFVHENDVRLDGVGRIATERSRRRIEAEQSVQRRSLATGGLCESARGATGGGRERQSEVVGFEQVEQEARQRRLAGAGTTRDDEGRLFVSDPKRPNLITRELDPSARLEVTKLSFGETELSRSSGRAA